MPPSRKRAAEPSSAADGTAEEAKRYRSAIDEMAPSSFLEKVLCGCAAMRAPIIIRTPYFEQSLSICLATVLSNSVSVRTTAAATRGVSEAARWQLMVRAETHAADATACVVTMTVRRSGATSEKSMPSDDAAATRRARRSAATTTMMDDRELESVNFEL